MVVAMVVAIVVAIVVFAAIVVIIVSGGSLNCLISNGKKNHLFG